ncbi:putative membrane protein, partial [Vibrio parahaemolyticus V-223/04]
HRADYLSSHCMP